MEIYKNFLIVVYRVKPYLVYVVSLPRARPKARWSHAEKKSENRVGPTWRKSENRDCRERVNNM